VIAAHTDATGGNSYASQESMRASAGLADTAGVRRVLRRLVAIGVIAQEPRPGKTTIWTLNLEYTPVANDRGTPVPDNRSEVQVDPGPTPVRPRSSGTYEGEGEGTTTSLALHTEAKDVREGEVEFDPRNIVSLRKVGAA